VAGEFFYVWRLQTVRLEASNDAFGGFKAEVWRLQNRGLEASNNKKKRKLFGTYEINVYLCSGYITDMNILQKTIY